MIFLTVGTQLPFDRLVRAVDDWAGLTGTAVFGQIGPAATPPRHIEHRPFLTPDACRERMASASVVIAHAGVGTILGALELGRPLVIVPRRADLGEHRNDHQFATARRFAGLDGVTVAPHEGEIGPALTMLSANRAAPRLGPHASPDLIDALRAFLCDRALPPPQPAAASLASQDWLGTPSG